MNRFRRIQSEFGNIALLRAVLLPVGLLGMALFDYFVFSSMTAGLIASAGLLIGFLFKEKIPEGVEYYTRVFPAGLFIYSIVLTLGDLVGFDNGTKIAIITATTVIVFNLEFWSLSDPSVMNLERSSD